MVIRVLLARFVRPFIHQDECHCFLHYCPNFIILILQCGQPMQMSRCVDCGLVIGGQNHAPVQGFQHLQFQYGLQTFVEKT